MRTVQGGSRVAVGLVAVLLLVACGDDDNKASSGQAATTVAPTTSTTLSQAQLDGQRAKRIVLTAADVPGFTEDPPDSGGDNTPESEAAVNACLDNNRAIIQLGADDDPRGAASPDFSKGENLSVSSTVTFADSDEQAHSAIVGLSTAAFPTCFSRAISAEVRKDTTLSNVTVTTTKLAALRVGDESVGLRNVVKFRTGGQSVTVNTDSTFVRVGRALAVLEDSSVTTPFPEPERARLATLIAGRMAAP